MDVGLATFLGTVTAAIIAVIGGFLLRDRRKKAQSRGTRRTESSDQLEAWQKRLTSMDVRVYERMDAQIEDLVHDMTAVKAERVADRAEWITERSALTLRIRSLEDLYRKMRQMLLDRGVDAESIPREDAV